MSNSVVLQKLASYDHAIDADQVAAVFGIDRRSIYHHVRKGSIPHFHLGGSLMFDPGVLAAWHEKQQQQGQVTQVSEVVRETVHQ